ncbi:3-demethylubiquinone-9 3-methyltransferase [Aaosphaeria arxii CBS 175.79]|uniref:3-demethylubiquinone-9 3-methyltransferase n=1 Tax=Aaosphaeria arxii CBS 175.79 TaxID=1450172 RepID=A0A6A5XBA8_9PLEO|nr:3-demethylubiquinone-9 3-methyltransferase [Aaosphaeria arxii CBS 175.79]KAF2010126.1 3-demethylubiquinone-9 3-methyltransferase [Aaosphaeria arxii CBS 175.79]
MSFKITPCLWMDTEGETAAKFYTSIFPNSSITHIQPYSTAGQSIHKHTPGSAMTIDFTLNNNPFQILNGGPEPKPNMATSFIIYVDDQKELDYYFEKLGEGGDDEMKVCGWVVDKYGVSWQLVPRDLERWMKEGSQGQVERVTDAFMGMKKLDIEGMRKAFEGEK